MRSIATFLILGIFISGPVFAEGRDDESLPLELWDALRTVLPDRWTAQVRWTREYTAMFETPLVRESERINVQRLYLCHLQSKRWTCALSHEEINIDANGLRHRARVDKVGRDVVVRIVDYIFSACFYAQRDALGEKGRARWGDYKRPIYLILGIGGGVYSVGTGGGGSGVSFSVEADPASAADCGFQLKSVGGHISMPNRRIDTDRFPAGHAER